MSDQKFIKINLMQLVADLGSSYSHSERDSYTEECPICQERITQMMSECGTCHTPVIWFDSPLWKEIYGQPNTQARILSIVLPEDPVGRELMQLARRKGFDNQSQADRWKKSYAVLGEQRSRKLIKWVGEHSGGRNGNAVLSWCMNLMAKTAAEATGNAPIVPVTPSAAPTKGDSILRLS